MAKKLEVLVFDEAKVNVGKYNFSPNKAEKVCHHNICKELKSISTESGFPLGVLVYIGIGGDAHKASTFAKGYKTFDKEKVERIIRMCKIFSRYFDGGSGMAHNDKLVHALCRFDKVISTEDNIKFFTDCLYKIDLGERLKMNRFKNSAELGKFIFGDALEYNEKGYFIGIAN